MLDTITWLQGVRTAAQIEHRWTKVLQAGLVKGPFTEQEDALLLDAVLNEGLTDWGDVAQRVPGRTGETGCHTFRSRTLSYRGVRE